MKQVCIIIRHQQTTDTQTITAPSIIVGVFTYYKTATEHLENAGFHKIRYANMWERTNGASLVQHAFIETHQVQKKPMYWEKIGRTEKNERMQKVRSHLDIKNTKTKMVPSLPQPLLEPGKTTQLENKTRRRK